MIIHHKTPTARINRLISFKTVKPQRRKKFLKKLTKSNKDFLKSLGFKL